MAPIAPETACPRPGLPRGAWRRYLGFFFVLPLLIYPFPYLAERIPYLRELSTTTSSSLLDSSHNLAGENADVVIFGDSTALFGVDTPELSHVLGQKVINIPSTAGSLSNVGDWALRQYLVSNRPPHLIIFYFAPFNLNFEEGENAFPYDGDEQMLRHGTGREVLTFSRHHLLEMLAFPFRYYVTPNRVSAGWIRGSLQESTPHQGFVRYWWPSGMDHGCHFVPGIVSRQSMSSVEALVQKYRSPQTRVLVDVSPIPACDNAQAFASRNYSRLGAAAPVILPAKEFAGDNSFAHPMPSYIDQTTALLAEAIRKAGALPRKSTPPYNPQ